MGIFDFFKPKTSLKNGQSKNYNPKDDEWHPLNNKLNYPKSFLQSLHASEDLEIAKQQKIDIEYGLANLHEQRQNMEVMLHYWSEFPKTKDQNIISKSKKYYTYKMIELDQAIQDGNKAFNEVITIIAKK